MPEQQKRQTAYKIRIKHLLNSQYFKEEGWLPNYVVVGNKKVSRVNIMGTIISNESGEAVIDDGSGNILLRSFGDNKELMDLQISETILVIGKIREYASQKYINPEIIKKVNKEWLALRELELQKEELLNPITETAITKTETGKTPQQTPFQEAVTEEAVAGEEVLETAGSREEKEVYETIKQLDSGEGALIEEIIQRNSNAENIISKLLNKGDVFEIKPGRIKVLE